MLFVFSTQLANQAAEAVKCGRFPNVITFHQSLEETKRHLSKHTPAAIKYSPAKINVGRSMSSFGNSNNQLSECSSVSSPRTSTNSEPSDLQSSKFSLVKLENTQQCSSASKSVDDKKSNESLCVSSSAGGGPNLSDNVYSPGADTGNLPLTDVPFTNSGGDPLEKMARLTQETLPFEPPLKQPRLGSPREKPKIPDDQLTPAARQHRQEALQKIEGLKQVFGLSPVQQTHLFLPGQPPSVMGLPPPDGIKLEQTSCSSANSSVEAQIKWQQRVEEHEMEKKIQIGGGVNKVSMPGSVPTMMVQGKPAVMVHPVTAPRHFNPRGGRAPGPRLMPPMQQNSDGFFQPGPSNFDPNFCGNFEFVPQQQQSRCFVIQQSRMPNGVGGPPGQPMFIPRSMAPTGTSMNVNMNIHVNPPQDNGGMPQPCYQEFIGPFDDEDPYFDAGYPPGMCGNMPPMSSNTYFCGPTGVVYEDGSSNGMAPPRGNGMPPNFTMESYPNKGQQMSTGGPPPMVNNTFVNATMSIQQVNIQNVSPFPPGNIVRVQSMQPSQPGQPMHWGCGAGGPPQQPPPQSQQQFTRRQASYSPMQMAPLRTFGPESTRLFLQDFAEPLRNLDSKVPSQKLQYFPNSSQPRPYDTQSAPINGPQPPPPQLAHQPSPSDSRDSATAPNVVPSFTPTVDGNGRPGDVNYDAQFQNFQQQLYSINPRRSDSMPN